MATRPICDGCTRVIGDNDGHLTVTIRRHVRIVSRPGWFGRGEVPRVRNLCCVHGRETFDLCSADCLADVMTKVEAADAGY
jgi:hypothetical protein